MSQLAKWKGSWGDDYTKRNLLTAEDQLPLFRRILFDLGPKMNAIVEVGCGAGHNMEALQLLFEHALVIGVEPNTVAADKSRRKDLIVLDTSVYELGWFPDATVDLIFTMGVLIHIPPDRLLEAMTEIVRVSRRYILAIEYCSAEPIMVEYRGEKDMLWKRDFGTMYMKKFPLYLVKGGKIIHLGEELTWWLMTK